MSDVLLQARNVRRSYGGRTVVALDELQVQRGEVLAVLGPNGSGKSTLFRMLALVEQPDSGEIIYEGTRVQRGQADGRIVGVFQQPFLFSGSVRSNIGFGLRRFTAQERETRISSAAEAFGLSALLNESVRNLSGGEAQRVALARAVALRPSVLLLDEPTSNLDVLVKRTFREDVERAARTFAGAVVLITHDPAEAFGLADRIAVMDAGRIVQSGTPEDLLDDPRTPFVASFTGAELLLDGVIATVAEDLVQVDVGGTLVWATVPRDHSWTPERGMRAHVAYRPEDVMISVPDGTARELSARNQFRLRIAGVNGSGGLVRLRLDGIVQLVALVTRNSVESMGLRPGKEIHAHMKATALRVMRAG